MAEQMTLGELIATLKRKEPESPIYFDFVHFRPCGIHSYRGYYDQLAIGYGHDDITVGQLLALCQDANGKMFTGYKGGDYIMTVDTPLWVALDNESGDTAIMDVRDQGWRTVLVTASVD